MDLSLSFLLWAALGLGFLAVALLSNGVLGTVEANNRRIAAEVENLSPYDLARRKSPWGQAIPFLDPLVAFFRRSLPGLAAWADRNYARQLLQAGAPGNLTGEQFLALKCVFSLVTFVLVLLILAQDHPLTPVLFPLIAFFMPDLQLKQMVSTNLADISRRLPDALDTLSLMVGAGQDLGQAVDVYLKTAEPSRLREELALFKDEVRLGRSRSEALLAMASRIESPVMDDFVRTVVQAEKSGTSMADTLAAQAEEIRTKRFQLAEVKGQKATVKLLIPLLLLNLPSCFLVLFGPMIVQSIK